MSNRNLINLLKDIVTQSVKNAFSLDSEPLIEITQSTQDKFGHYQCNSAMKLSKDLKTPPRAIAEMIVKNIESNPDTSLLFSHMEVAGPGFINFSFSSSFLSKRLRELFKDPNFGAHSDKRERVIVEFSSPNIAKEMHVGHLRSTIIGECLARLFEFLGHDVLRLNHVGDWGTQFGMLITYIKDVDPQILAGSHSCDLSTLMNWYKASKKRFDEDETFKTKARLEVVALQSGEKTSVKAWEILCKISRESYQKIYDLLDAHLIERGESFYNPLLPQIVSDLESKGLVTISDGAKCIYLEGFQNREGEALPLMIQKSDGGYNYDTTDMAALYHRVTVEKADRIIVVVDSGQSLHFQLVYQAAIKAQYIDPKKVRFDHVGFGLVLGPDGKKFKTRSGETEKLIDLLNRAVDEARKILEERGVELGEQEKDKLAHVLGIGAVKYADLSANRIGDYAFSYERMLKFEGNTAAFLLYSYVRIHGIKRKIADINTETLLNDLDQLNLAHPSEIALGIHLLQFSEMIQIFALDLYPHRLTEYLYALAQKFNAFFRDCRVEGVNEQNSRLLLCELTANVLKTGLHILGLETVERM